MEYKLQWPVMVTRMGPSNQDIERDRSVTVREEKSGLNRIELTERAEVLGAREDPQIGDLQPQISKEDGRTGDPLEGQGGLGVTPLEQTTRPDPTLGSDGDNVALKTTVKKYCSVPR